MAWNPRSAAMAAGSPSPPAPTSSPRICLGLRGCDVPLLLQHGQRRQRGRRHGIGTVRRQVVLEVDQHPPRVATAAMASRPGGPGPARRRARRPRSTGRRRPARATRRSGGRRRQRRGSPPPRRPPATGGRGRARGSTGSRRRPPSSAACACARRSRPSDGSPGARPPRCSSSSICRRASYSMARPSDRTELRFLISQRVPKGSPGRRTDTLASTRIDPSSILASERVGGDEDGPQLVDVLPGLFGSCGCRGDRRSRPEGRRPGCSRRASSRCRGSARRCRRRGWTCRCPPRGGPVRCRCAARTAAPTSRRR